LVLEPLERALARGAKVYGELTGYGASLDAYRPTAPEPEGRGAALAMKMALRTAGWTPEDVQYVNAHGTSTPLNDKTETNAIKHVLGAHAYKIPVSSTKSQIGHLVAGAGAVELIVGLVAMNEGFLPATINLQHPDPECDLDYVQGAVRELVYDRFLSNSFAFGGQNACIAAARYAS
jgi:3-oxoacyl-[acyl-carrier-protein] synthase II